MKQKPSDALQFGDYLRDLRNAAGLSLRDVGERIDVSAAHLSRIETAKTTSTPDRPDVLALARAIGAGERETDRLLELAGHHPETILDLPGFDSNDERLRRLLRLVLQLRSESLHTAGLTEQALLYLLDGALRADTAPAVRDETISTITAEEEAIDQALSGLVAGDCSQFDAIPEIDALPWEIRRRIAESLPVLAQLDVVPVAEWAQKLRLDMDPEYGPDIRRRVVEGVPEMSQVYFDARKLLPPVEGDNIYVLIAIAEAAHDLDQVANVEGALRDAQLPEHAGVIEFLLGLLQQPPERAISAIREARTEDRIFRVVCVRSLRRVLPDMPQKAMEEYLYFLRRRAGHPVEHRNVRRPAAIAVPSLVDLLNTEHDLVARVILQRLAEEDDVFIRRGVADHLDEPLPTSIIRMLVNDPDPYIRRRAWSARTGE